jgi:hypothetical protein
MNDRNDRARALQFAKDLAEPDWSLSVPKVAKDNIRKLLAIIEESKPRTITTPEELDALPVGSVVLNRGRSWQRYEPRTVGNYEYNIWQCPDGGFVRDIETGSLILPATVLHEPESES